MGLYDREWFWEGYEERHGINKKPTPSQTSQKQNNSPSKQESYVIQRVCKKCRSIISVTIPNYNTVFGYEWYQFTCPICGKLNKVGYWKKYALIIIGIIFLLFVIFCLFPLFLKVLINP